MNICKIRYIAGPLLLALVVLSCSCTANPQASLQQINTPAVTGDESATGAVAKISADNQTVTGAVPLDPNVRATGVPGAASGLTIISALNSDNMSDYSGKRVIVEGTVVELGSFIDPGLGNALVLYFNNRDQHMVSYEAWSKGMTGTDFRVIIRESDIPGICYRSMLVGRRMAVEGEMDIYHGAPVIFVSDPAQITFAGATPATEPSLAIVITCTTEIADNITWVRYQGTVTNNNTEWAVHDLYLGENKIIDCIPPKGCPNIAPMYLGKQTLTRVTQCPNYVKFDLKVSGDAGTGAGADPLTKQISVPALHYKWKSVPNQ